MKNTALIVSSVLMASLLASPVYADNKFKQRQNFTKTVTVNNEHGTGTRTIEQRVNNNGFTRTVNTQLNDGRSASKNITVVRNPEAKTRTKEVTGTRLNGESFYSKGQTTKTDTGFIHNGTTTNAQGQTASRNVVATVDQNTGIITKQITRVNFDGETTTETVVGSKDELRKKFKDKYKNR